MCLLLFCWYLFFKVFEADTVGPNINGPVVCRCFRTILRLDTGSLHHWHSWSRANCSLPCMAFRCVSMAHVGLPKKRDIWWYMVLVLVGKLSIAIRIITGISGNFQTHLTNAFRNVFRVAAPSPGRSITWQNLPQPLQQVYYDLGIW